MSGLEGRTIGEFKLLTKVGQGGMGSVYLAEQPALNRRVAVKVLLPDLVHDPQFPKRFKREAMLAASINHPGIVQVYAAGEIEDIHYLAMEYVDGESLQRRMEREGRIKPDDALSIIIRLTQALDYAWQKARLIHRDIKPSNVLISTDGEVKLADFGMARNADIDSNLTATGMPIGTPLYISPEQARCIRELDFTTDIYSLGCTLYHMLTGRAPYVAEASFAVMLLHITEPAPSILDHMPDCPPAIVQVLERMLAKETTKRPASYAELIEELNAARHGTKTKSYQRPPSRPLAIAAGVLVLAAGGWYFAPKSKITAAATNAPTTTAVALALPSALPLEDDAFVREVATLPAEAQAKRVIARLKELNREFDPTTATYSTENDTVVDFSLDITAITDLTPVRAFTSLKRLHLGKKGQTSALSTLEPLRGLPLAQLDLYNSNVHNLAPLTGMPLKRLNCVGSPITDLTPLKGCPLEALGINDSEVSDLSPLEGMPLRFLNVGLTQVSSLAPLKGMRLIDVNCTGTSVQNLSPLEGMLLTRLICNDTSIQDLSPIREMPLRELECDFDPGRDTEILRSISTLEKINGVSAREFWSRR